MSQDRVPHPPREPDRGEPDRVALDELLRAFGVDVEAAERDDAVPADPPSGADLTDEQLDALLADDVAEVPPAESEAAAAESHGTEPDEPASEHEEPASEPDEPELEAPPAETGATPSEVAPKVIRISGDELADTVYVKGDLGADASPGGGGVVLIEDDNTGDALVPDASGRFGRGIEPRLRARRISVRRAEGRRRLRWVVLAAAVVLLLVAGLAVLGSPLFAVDAGRVRVTGAVYTDPDRLDEIIDDLVGTPVLTVDTEAIERQLEAIPWVDRARVTTEFPRGAAIEIRERKPLATFQGPDGRFRVLDRYGRVLDVLDGQPIAYMLVTSPDGADLAPGEFASAGFRGAAELVQSLTASVRDSVASVEVAGDGSQLRLLLDDGVEVRFGAASDLLAKLVRLEQALQRARDGGARIIDVSTNEVTIR